MTAVQVYEWDYIAPGGTVGLFLHGFGVGQYGVFDAVPVEIDNTDTDYTPLYDITLTQGEVSIHVDGTYARTTHIQNMAPFNSAGAVLFFIYA